MPTAGEARLKSKSSKTVKNGTAAIAKRRIAVKSSGNNSSLAAKQNTVQSLRSGKSLIPISAKRGGKGKENTEPNADHSVGTSRKSTKAKQAPDFSKLHEKWQNQLAKGKAVSKKQNTRVEPFHLAEHGRQSQKAKRPYAHISEDEEDVDSDEEEFQVDSTALKGILSNTGITSDDLRTNGGITTSTVPSSSSNLACNTGPPGGILKRNSIYYTGNTTQNHLSTITSHSTFKPLCTPTSSQPLVAPLKPHNVEAASVRPQAPPSSVKKKLAWADQVSENDVFDFQPDTQSLRSILSNTGISNSQLRSQNTGRVTLAGGRPSTAYRRGQRLYSEEPSKRTSIYYTGPKRTRPSPSRLGLGTGRMSVVDFRHVTSGAGAKLLTTAYNPSGTIVGVQGEQLSDDYGPVACSSSRTISTAPASCSQALSTPVRQSVAQAQTPSREQSCWPGMFTPQRGTSVQDSVANQYSSTQATCSQASLRLLSTPGQQPLFNVQDPSGTQRPLQTEVYTQPQGTGIPNSNNSTAQDSRPQSSIDPFSIPARPSVYGHQASRSEQQPRWSEIFTPQRGTGIQGAGTKQHSVFQTPSGNVISTPARQPLFTTQASCSLPQPRFTPQRGTTFDTSPYPRVLASGAQSSVNPSSTVASERQPLFNTQTACSTNQPSWAEILTPQQQSSSLQSRDLRSTSTKELDEIAQLERQALEDLRLLRILSTPLNEETSSREKIQQNAENTMMPPPTTLNGWMNPSNRNLSRTELTTVIESPVWQDCEPSSVCSSQESAVFSRNPISTSGEVHVTSLASENCSKFAAPVVFATPTPVKRSRTTLHDSLYSSSSLQGGTQLVGSTSVTYPNRTDSVRPAVGMFSAQGTQLVGSITATSSDTYPKLTDSVRPAVGMSSVQSGLHENVTPSVTHPKLTDSVRPVVGMSSGSSVMKRSQLNSAPGLAPTPIRSLSCSAPLPSYNQSVAPSLSLKNSVNSSFVNVGSQFRPPLPKPLEERSVQFVSPAPKTQHNKHVTSDQTSLSLRSAVSSGFSAFSTLCDMEVSVHTASYRASSPKDWGQRLLNPLARVFVEGDSMHFVPIGDE